jgi:hypothetical protein
MMKVIKCHLRTSIVIRIYTKLLLSVHHSTDLLDFVNLHPEHSNATSL